MSQPEIGVKKTWWGRNWIWVLPTILVPTVLCAVLVLVGGILTIVFTAIKSTDAYQEAVAKAKKSDTVVAALGAPVEEGMLVTGNVRMNGANGNADLTIPLSGPKASASVHAVAQKRGGAWTYSVLEVVVEGTGQRIDLLADKK